MKLFWTTKKTMYCTLFSVQVTWSQWSRKLAALQWIEEEQQFIPKPTSEIHDTLRSYKQTRHPHNQFSSTVTPPPSTVSQDPEWRGSYRHSPSSPTVTPPSTVLTLNEEGTFSLGVLMPTRTSTAVITQMAIITAKSEKICKYGSCGLGYGSR